MNIERIDFPNININNRKILISSLINFQSFQTIEKYNQYAQNPTNTHYEAWIDAEYDFYKFQKNLRELTK